MNSDRAIQFRRWATNILKKFSKKGYIIDKKRMELLEHSELYSDSSITVRIYNLNTNKECEHRGEIVLNTPLPVDNKKGYIRNKKR